MTYIISKPPLEADFSELLIRGNFMAHKVKIWVHEKQNYKQVWGLIEVNWLSGCFIDEYELVGKAKGMVVTTFSIKEIPNERFSYTVKNEHPELPYMSKSEIRKVLCEKYK